MNSAPAIAVTGLRKAYADKVVLDGLDLTVPQGTVFALLGPNGAGKTTTVDILSTLTRADGGEARIAGHDLRREPDAVRSSIALTGQFSAVDDLLTGAENLRLMADLLHLGRPEGRRRAADLLARFDLADAADRVPSTYSGGMRRRLDLAMGLMGDPRVVFLDEPTTGLDPRSRRAMWDVVRGLVADGVTVLLTTQYLEEADQLADRIGVLDSGRLVAEGTADELKRLVPGGHVRLQFDDAASLHEAARALGRDDFAAFTANWTDKATNLEGIAKSLNIGLDALVFVDDNPVERDQVRARLPMVAVPEMGADPAAYVAILAEGGFFEAATFTADDAARAGQYAANAARDAEAAGAGDMDSFLRGLAMEAEAGPVTALTLARATQLINKTNQFNTTTLRRTEAEVAALMADPAAVTLTLRLADKFGDNGIVAVALAAPSDRPGVLEIQNWVMSCRVFGRQLEEETLNLLAASARAQGAAVLRAPFLPTAKNGVIRDLFERLGFTPDPDFTPPAEAPETLGFRLDLAGYAPRPTRIAVRRTGIPQVSEGPRSSEGIPA